MEEGGRHYVGQKTEKQLKGKFLNTGNTGTYRETGGDR